METQYTDRSQPAPRRRKKRQQLRLQKKFKSLLAGIPDLVVIDRDPLFQALLDSLSNQPPETVSFQVMTNGSPITVVAVPTRIWFNPRAMAMVTKVKQRMLEFNRTCILLSQDVIQAEPAQETDPAVVQRLFSAGVRRTPQSAESPSRLHDSAKHLAHSTQPGQPTVPI